MLIYPTPPADRNPKVGDRHVLEAAGKVTGEYWHAGHLTTMETVPFGPGGSPWVVLGGVDNGRHRATLVFLDPKNVHGVSAEEDDAYHLPGRTREDLAEIEVERQHDPLLGEALLEDVAIRQSLQTLVAEIVVSNGHP